jgi:hypothetical protein
MKKNRERLSAESAPMEGQPLDELDWYFLDGAEARIFRPGERIERGERLGIHAAHDVIAEESGAVRSIQYDIWRDQVIVGIARVSSIFLGGQRIRVA